MKYNDQLKPDEYQALVNHLLNMRNREGFQSRQFLEFFYLPELPNCFGHGFDLTMFVADLAVYNYQPYIDILDQHFYDGDLLLTLDEHGQQVAELNLDNFIFDRDSHDANTRALYSGLGLQTFIETMVYQWFKPHVFEKLNGVLINGSHDYPQFIKHNLHKHLAVNAKIKNRKELPVNKLLQLNLNNHDLTQLKHRPEFFNSTTNPKTGRAQNEVEKVFAREQKRAVKKRIDFELRILRQEQKHVKQLQAQCLAEWNEYAQHVKEKIRETKLGNFSND